jgi:hypothetical protein
VRKQKNTKQIEDCEAVYQQHIEIYRVFRWPRRDRAIVKRAQGGSDFDRDRLVALCPPCHAQTDAPYARGRLSGTPLGAGRFTAEVTRGADKWAIRA